MLPKPINTIELLELLCTQLRQTVSQTSLPVSEWAKQWLDIVIPGKGYSQRISIENAVKNHILPIIGTMPIADVSYADAARVMAAAAEYSYSLQSKILTTMKSMFELARRTRLIIDNPCDGLKAGGKKSPEKSALSVAQQAMLEQAVCGTKAETFVLIGLYTGLRREEILGLQWDCVDLYSEAPSLTVKRALHWEHCRPVIVDELKSKAAFRTIPLPKKLISHLMSCPHQGKYVIGGDQPLSETQFKNLWQIIKRRTVDDPADLGTTATNSKMVRSLPFRVTPHQLRHTYITRMIMGGANIKRVQYLAGHSNMQITLRIYTHLLDNSPTALSKEVNAIFGSV